MKHFFMDGWITSAPIEAKQTQSGKTVITFSVNSPSRRKNTQTGEWESTPQFFSCKYWSNGPDDRRAAAIIPNAKVFIAGKPTFEEWTTQDGSKRSKVVMLCEEIHAIATPAPGAAAPAGSVPANPAPGLYDEDIPF